MQTKIIQRPIRKLCPLIVETKEEELIKQQTKPSRSYNLRPKTAHLITAILIFFGLLFGTDATTENNTIHQCIKITPFQNNAGIYFEDDCIF